MRKIQRLETETGFQAAGERKQNLEAITASAKQDLVYSLPRTYCPVVKSYPARDLTLKARI